MGRLAPRNSLISENGRRVRRPRLGGPTHAVAFDGFGDGAFSFFEKVAARPSWDYVVSLRPEWEHEVHLPMEQLRDRLGDEFGRDLYAFNLHRDPYLWSHQVGGLSVTDTIVYPQTTCPQTSSGPACSRRKRVEPGPPLGPTHVVGEEPLCAAEMPTAKPCANE